MFKHVVEHRHRLLKDTDAQYAIKGKIKEKLYFLT